MGGITGPRHQVSHPTYQVLHPDSQVSLLPLSLRAYGVTIMMRSCVFADNVRRMNQTPSPKYGWDALTVSVRNLLASGGLVLPTLQQCEEEL